MSDHTSECPIHGVPLADAGGQQVCPVCWQEAQVRPQLQEVPRKSNRDRLVELERLLWN